MNNDHPYHDSSKMRFLNLRHLPGRMNREQTAWFLGFEPHHVTHLVTAGLLTPMGRTKQNSTLYFPTCILEAKMQDASWLDKATSVAQRLMDPEAIKKMKETKVNKRSRVGGPSK